MKIRNRLLLGSLLALSLCSCGGMEEDVLQGDEVQPLPQSLKYWNLVFNYMTFLDVHTREMIPGVTLAATVTSPAGHYVQDITQPDQGFGSVLTMCEGYGANCTQWPTLQMWASHPSYVSISKVYNTGNYQNDPFFPSSSRDFTMVPICQDHSPCHGYRCNLSTGICRTSCGGTSNIKCAAGYRCVNRDCVL